MARARTRIADSPDSYKAESNSEVDSYIPDAPDSPPSPKRRKTTKSSKAAIRRSAGTADAPILLDTQDGPTVNRTHAREYHSTTAVAALQQQLLDWFESVRDKRGMPWRKRYDHSLGPQEKGQRAYEIWVSEVMLQQTQVTTVIDYWRRWMERWPTIADLAKADVEEVNAAWRGLGYYRRARSLLAGAKTVMKKPKLNGRLPRDPGDMEDEIDGVGRYTAGAISSMAYGMRAPIVDGNVHRLFTRLFGVHASQTGPATIKYLWQAAEELVEALPEVKGIAGDWNQAIMELGSQVCKPVAPDCASCPLQPSCKAFAELTIPPPKPVSGECDLCARIPANEETECIPTVTVFPMKKEKKASREEQEVVCVVEWDRAADRKWLFTKRPEKGLLAGLFQPPTVAVPTSATFEEHYDASLASIASILDTADVAATVKTKRHVGSIPHIFSHINMTYHIIHLVLSPSESQLDLPTPAEEKGVWLDAGEVERANVGTGVKKVWAEVYGAWGSVEVKEANLGSKKRSGSSTPSSIKPTKAAKVTKSSTKGPKAIAKKAKVTTEGIVADAEKSVAVVQTKVVKQVMLPMMPKRSVDAEA